MLGWIQSMCCLIEILFKCFPQILHSILSNLYYLLICLDNGWWNTASCLDFASIDMIFGQIWQTILSLFLYLRVAPLCTRSLWVAKSLILIFWRQTEQITSFGSSLAWCNLLWVTKLHSSISVLQILQKCFYWWAITMCLFNLWLCITLQQSWHFT